jgi:hypothetical protein
VERICPINLDLVLGRRRQVVDDMYPLDDEDIPFRLDLPPRIRKKPIRSNADLACLQRTAEGAGQSAGGSGDDVIESGGMRFGVVGGNPVMGGDRSMDPEQDRLRFCRKVCPAQRPLDPFDPHLRNIGN